MLSDLAHAEHPVASPLDDQAVDRLLRLVLDGQRSVLDLGCGDGTWLLHALRQDARLRAVGVDVSGAGFDRVRTAAEQARPRRRHVSSLQEWDGYEWSWTGSLTRWAVDHPDDPESDEVHRVAADHRRAWLEGYRGTLGFLTLLLAPRPAHLSA